MLVLPCVCALALLVAPRGAPGLVVSRAALRLEGEAASESSRVSMTLLLTANDVGPGFGTDLAADAVSLTATDGGAFNVTFGLTGCRILSRGLVYCESTDGRVRATLVRVHDSPFVYKLRVHASSLTADTGLASLNNVVRVTLRQSSPAERVGTVAGCRLRLGRNLWCQGARRPNLVFIVTDDQRWDTLQYMPNVLNLLAAQGVMFNNGFVTTSVCTPSRASMLVGQYPHNSGVRTIGAPDGGALRFVGRDASTLATWLHDAGYRTGMYGKYLLGYQQQCPPSTTSCYVPPGWDEWHVFLQQGYFNYKLAEGAAVKTYGSDASDYSTDVLAAKAASFIASANGQPFFLHWAPAAPHNDGIDWPEPAPRHHDLFADLSPWRPPSYDEDDIADKPSHIQAFPRATDVLNALFTYGTWGAGTRRAQLASLAAIDEAVAALVAALEAAGELDNTVIVYTSDNGFQWGEHRSFFAKGFAFEESIRVPFIVRAPATTPRQESALVVNIDIAPTLAELAGVTPSSAVDGLSLVPLLQGETSSWRQDFLIEYYDAPAYNGIRSEEWKYVEYPSTGETELYDLENDPFELQSVSGDPLYQSVEDGLRARLTELLPETP